MPETDERTTQEIEFIMEGITTRMQIAMEKMSDANRMMSEAAREANNTVRHVSRTYVAVLILVIAGFIVYHAMWIAHVNDLRASGVVSASEEILELRPGADD